MKELQLPDLAQYNQLVIVFFSFVIIVNLDCYASSLTPIQTFTANP